MKTQPFAGAHRRLGVALVVTSACLVAACGAETSGGAFRPSVPSGSAGATYAASSYRVEVGANDLGKATVWTEGQRKNRVIDVRVRVQNESTAPMTLDAEQSTLAVATRSAGTVLVHTPVKVQGVSEVGPDSTTAVNLAYQLPESVATNDVIGFKLNWLLRTKQGDYRQATQFVRAYGTERQGTCPSYYGALGYCAGWDRGQWVGYDDPNDPAMPLSFPVGVPAH
jgi:hypothetical protein